MKNYSYNIIASDYDLKRKKPWKPLEIYLNYLKDKGYSFKGLSVDLGCGNGRHFLLLYNSDSRLLGIDNSIELLKIARTNLNEESQYTKNQRDNIQLVLADFTSLPIRAQRVQNIFSIATLHHGKNKLERIKAVSGIYNVLSNNGMIFITVWRRWQKKYKKYFVIDWLKRTFNFKYKNQQNKIGLTEFGDKRVPWKISTEKIACYRFYHFYSKRELKKSIKHFSVKVLNKFGGATNKENYFVLAQKA
jgi:SAM-dependent methyltransferase